MCVCVLCSPHPPLPLSATLTETEAAIIIQAYYRGYHLRCTNLYVIEFRKWQRRYAEEKAAARVIQKWWRRLYVTIEMRIRRKKAKNAGSETARETRKERENTMEDIN